MYSNHPYLMEIKTSVYHIPERLKEIDPSLFVVWNNRKHRIEIHSTENKGNTFYMALPFNELDSRVIDYVHHNMKAREQGLLRFIDSHNRKIEEKNERDKRNWIKDVAEETRWFVKKDKEELGL